jgi:hypothetical protein
LFHSSRHNFADGTSPFLSLHLFLSLVGQEKAVFVSFIRLISTLKWEHLSEIEMFHLVSNALPLRLKKTSGVGGRTLIG